MTKKLTIEEMHQLAKSKGGKCLSKEYIHSTKKLKWECKEGHRWKCYPHSIKHINVWCPICPFQSRIKEMQRFAKNKGGRCLSTKYNGYTKKLKWECKEGHRWRDTPANVKLGRWCLLCIKRICPACKKIFSPTQYDHGRQKYCSIKCCNYVIHNSKKAKKQRLQYRRSEKGKEVRRKYQLSEHYKDYVKKRNKSKKHKEYMRKYMKSYSKEYQKKYQYSDAFKRAQKKYKETHKKEIKAKNKIYRETHKEELKEKNKIYCETHKDQIKEIKKRYRDKRRNQKVYIALSLI